MSAKLIPTRASKLLIVLGLLVSVSAAPVRSFDVASANNPTPITVSATPGVALPGTLVTIKGSTGIDVAGPPQVKLTITPPAGAQPVTLAVPATKEGNFSTTFSQTKAIGKYSIKAISPGGRGDATTTFSIAPPASVFQQYDGELQALSPVAEKGLDRAKEIIADLPDSSDKAEAQKKLDKLTEKVKQIRQSVSLAAITKPLRDRISRAPEDGARLAPLFKALGEWETESRAERVHINEELIKSGKEGEQCEKMDQAIEAVSLANAILNLIAKPIGIVLNLVQDLIAAKVPSEAGGIEFNTAANLTRSYAQDEERLVGPAGMTIKKYAELGDTALGLAFDLSNFFLKGYYGKFCERLEGPLEGKMVGQVTEGGVPWWKFTIGLKGKLVLRHAKSNPGAAVRVRGQFIGIGSDFEIFEDVVNVKFAETVRKNRAITFHHVTIPAIDFGDLNALLQEEGAAASTLARPASFYIPVEGDLVKNKLTLRVKEARFDFNDDLIAAHALYFLIGPTGAEFIDQKFPFQKAHNVITHAMNAETSGTAELKVSVDAAKKQTIISGDFNRDFHNGETTATYTLNVKACNPSCFQ